MNGPNRAQQMNGPNRAQQMNGPNRAQMNLLENTKNHPPKKFPKDQKRPDFWKPIAPKSQWDFLTNRELELIYKARQVRNQKLIW